jgi:hypothetical protein
MDLNSIPLAIRCILALIVVILTGVAVGWLVVQQLEEKPYVRPKTSTSTSTGPAADLWREARRSKSEPGSQDAGGEGEASGAIPLMITCPTCRGTKVTQTWKYDPKQKSSVATNVPCTTCDGTGSVPDTGKQVCKVCSCELPAYAFDEDGVCIDCSH